MLLRLGRVLLGTLGMALSVPVLIIPPPGDGDWLFLLLLLLKILLGLALVMLSLDQYRKAAFPPGSPALSDPVMLWVGEQENRLYRTSKLLWLGSQLLILFVPVLLSGLMLAVVLRPIYTTLTSPRPNLPLLYREGSQTVRFLWASFKGLLWLTLSSLLGCGASLGTLVYFLNSLS